MYEFKNLPKWAKRRIVELEERVKHLELTLPWTKPGMDWCTVLHPDHRAKDTPEYVKLFVLYENGCHPVCTVGRKDVLFIGRGEAREP